MNKDTLKHLLVIDIETVPVCADFECMDKDWRTLWSDKAMKANPDVNVMEQYRLRSGVMAEFAKIVCIGIGHWDEKKNQFQINSFFGKNEALILKQFIDETTCLFSIKRNLKFAGHNIREFDLPFICRRLLVNGFIMPEFLDFQHKKPWEINLVDTFQWWRFGDYKNYTSLKLLAKVLGIKGSKDDMDGSMVAPLYWEENPVMQEMNLHRIATYCCNDVETTACVIQKFLGEKSIAEGQVVKNYKLMV
jgi:hypothetical protein